MIQGRLVTRCLAISLVVAALSVALLCIRSTFLEQVNLRLLDIKFRLRGERRPFGRVATVVIDNESLAAVGRWPWSRDAQARLIRGIASCKPAAIGLDVLFSRGEGGTPGDDHALLRAVRDAGTVVLANHFLLSPREAAFQTHSDFEQALEALRRNRIKSVLQTGPPCDDSAALQAYGAETAPSELSAAAAGSGFYNALAARDGSIRQMPLVIQAKEGFYPSLALETLRVAAGGGLLQLVLDGPRIRGVRLGERTVPCDDAGLYLVNYYASQDSFPSISAARILAGNFRREDLAGKIVLVGGIAPGVFELRVSPFNPVSSSVEIQALVVDNLLSGRVLRQDILGTAPTALAIVLFTPLMGLLLPIVRRPWYELLAVACVIAAYFVLDFMLFARGGRNLSTIYPLASLLVCSAGVTRFIAHRKETAFRLQRRTAFELSCLLSRVLNLEALYPRVLEAFMQITEAERGLFLTPGDEPGREMTVQAVRGMGAADWADPASAPRRQCVLRAVEGKCPVLIFSPRPPTAPPAVAGPPVRSMVCVPLADGSQVVGVIYLESSTSPPPFGLDGEVLSAFANQTVIAVRNADLYSRIEEHEVRLKSENIYLKGEVLAAQKPSFMIGNAPSMHKVFTLIKRAAASSITVLIEGETGTGKELIARAIHYTGPRSDKMFVAQNCSALTETLLESELFGHKKGAFTGATVDKKGLFEIADGGTMFLDEVGDTHPALQAKLLRVLQEGVIRPVGGLKEKRVDVRIISATNKSLLDEIQAGTFREDLYYRLNAFTIKAPALRERRSDIPLLVMHFIERFQKASNKSLKGISREAMDLLVRYDYPGNVRELENLIEQAVVMTQDGQMITSEFVAENTAMQPPAAGVPEVPHEGPGAPANLKEALNLVKRQWITRVLMKNGGNRAAAAKELGFSRKGLIYIIEQLKIEV